MAIGPRNKDLRKTIIAEVDAEHPATSAGQALPSTVRVLVTSHAITHFDETMDQPDLQMGDKVHELLERAHETVLAMIRSGELAETRFFKLTITVTYPGDEKDITSETTGSFKGVLDFFAELAYVSAVAANPETSGAAQA